MNYPSRALTFLAGLLAATSALQAQSVISVNLVNSRPDVSNDELASGTSAGVVVATNWNNVIGGGNASSAQATYTTLNVKNNLGNATTLDVATTSTGGGYQAGHTATTSGNHTLMFGTIGDVQSAPTTVSVSETPFASYDLYVYFAAPQFIGPPNNTITLNNGSTTLTKYTQATTFGDGLTSFTESNSSVAGTYAPGHYVRFTGLTGPSFDFTLSGDGRGLTGFQIVEATAIPEPSSFVVLASAATLGFAAVRRRRRA